MPSTAVDVTNTKRIDACRSGRFRWALVIPAFDEPADYLSQLTKELNQHSQNQRILIICVVNAPEDATSPQRERTLAMLPSPKDTGLRELGKGIHTICIDAATQPLPADQATGLARKLGCDIVCRLLSDGHITTPFLCNTDADATLPGDYFQRLSRAFATSPKAACILPFKHSSPDSNLQRAGTAYELYLRSLQLNLHHCGSPYAYPALGSLLAINPDLYAKTRGFPKRRAGEDFYLLNKLSKLGDIEYLTGAPVTLAARASHRVPFGTGPAIQKILRNETSNVSSPDVLDCPTYALASFALLRQFYDGISELNAGAQPERHLPSLPPAWRDPDLLWLLKSLGVPNALLRLRKNHRSKHGLMRAVHEWFDALKTIRFLNAARHFHQDESLLDQRAHLQRLLSHKPSQKRLEEPGEFDAADNLRLTAEALNHELEHYRSASRHSVALSVELAGTRAEAHCLTDQPPKG